MASLFKTAAGKAAIFRLYDQKLSELGIDYQTSTIPTRFGPTHLITCGDPAHPPIVIVHGSNGCAPIALETYPSLHRQFRVYAVDVLAQPTKSAETRLSMKDLSYGQWMNEVIDHLGLDQVTLAGFSLGGLVILKTLEYDESKIKAAYLTAPAYIVNGNPLKALFKVFIPMRRYLKTRQLKFVERFLAELFTERDEFAIQYLSQVFLHFDMDFSPVPVIKKQSAAAIRTPIHLFAAEEDLLFPGKKMIKRATKIFPSLQSSELIEGSKHVQNKAQNEMIERTILRIGPHNKKIIE